MADTRPTLDPLTEATVTVAWVIVANKPFYPLYVWYLVGSGVTASLLTLVSAPFFLAIPFIARRSPIVARIMLPVIGTLDTMFETKLFGTASGTALFLAACMMLAALSFRGEERWSQRGLVAFIFGAFLITRNWTGAPLHGWSERELSILFNLNAYAVASLLAFVALRYAGVERNMGSDPLA
ncbi:hypothetical protein D3C80_723950 [compost metagenome]